MIANILGTNYNIYSNVSEEEDKRIKGNYGCCDFSTHEILLSKELTKKEDNDIKNLEIFEKKVLRHEIIHAYFHESGLDYNTNCVEGWATNEEMVDWLAIQTPKIFKTFESLRILN